MPKSLPHLHSRGQARLQIWGTRQQTTKYISSRYTYIPQHQCRSQNPFDLDDFPLLCWGGILPTLGFRNVTNQILVVSARLLRKTIKQSFQLLIYMCCLNPYCFVFKHGMSVQAKDYYELLKFHNKIKYFVPKNSSGNQ